MRSLEAVENKGKARPSFDNTLRFVCDERVSSVPIDRKSQTPPLARGQTKKGWERMYWEMGEYLGTEKTLDEVGKDLGVTREAVRQNVKRGVENLWKAQSPEVQSEFSPDEFGYNKSRKLTASSQELANFKRFKEHVGELTSEKKQTFLDAVKNRRVFSVLSSGEKPLIVAVSKIAEQGGLFFPYSQVSIIYDLLRKSGVSASSFSDEIVVEDKKRQRSYHFICIVDMERAIEIIKDANELDCFRQNNVVVLGKPTDRKPRPSELGKSGYSSVSHLIKEIRGKRLGSKYRCEDIFREDSSVRVYRYKGGLYYLSEEKEKIRTYLSDRLYELGLF